MIDFLRRLESKLPADALEAIFVYLCLHADKFDVVPAYRESYGSFRWTQERRSDVF